MRIALLHYTLPPVIGGVERVIRDQAAALRKLGHEVECFADREAFRVWLDRAAVERECPHPQRIRSDARPADGDIRAPHGAAANEGGCVLQARPASEDTRAPKGPDARSPFQQVVHWMNYEDGHPYFEPAKDISKHRHGLPHWQQGGKLYFVTWRLGDALPQEKLRELREGRERWLEENPKPWAEGEEDRFREHFEGQVEEWLDAGLGRCVLQSPEVRQALEEVLHHSDGEVYDLLSYVIMPNHVHVLFRLHAGEALEELMKAWKGASSRKIGAVLGEKGRYWQEGYRDRMIRGPEHLGFVLGYIQRNPKEAKLTAGRFVWWECGRAVERGCPHPQAALNTEGTPASEDTRAPRGKADEDIRAPWGAVIVHNVFTMPFDLEWTRELTRLAEAHPELRWINWVHDVCSVNPAYAHIPWHEPVPRAVHVAVSEVRRADYERATGLALASIRMIPNGLDLASVLGLTERMANLAQAHGDRDLMLVHPTRLVRRKNIELGLQVVAALHEAGCDVVYVITGAPDPHQADGVAYHAELKRLAAEMGITERVFFLGEEEPLTDEDVRGLYDVADALFFPSTGEGFGLPLLEALAHRLPVFCSALPVHQEVLGTLGHYFQIAEDPKTISARIMRWLTTSQPTHHRKLLRQRFDIVKICQEHLEPLLLTAIE
ncbi:MAG: glycosyltransferase [Verrucomicrobiota bacterium]